jgi:serine/threonine-protein kinase
MVTEAGVPKITDLGLAKLLDVEQGRTQTGALLGSPSYMAPEQAIGNVRAIGPTTDVYALGAILYELLTGRPPFVGRSFLETLDQVRNHDPALPQALQPKLPADLAAICLKCLEKEPEQRYPSARALARDLDLFLHDEPITARKMSLWDQAASVVRYSQTDVNFGTWAARFLWQAPLPLLVHVAVFVFSWNRPEYPLAAISVSLLTQGVMLYSLLLGQRSSMRVIAPHQRRLQISSWLGHYIGLVLVLVAIGGMMHPRTPEEWFVVYPLWLIVTGCTYFSLGTNAGLMYIIGGLCFLTALLSLLVPFYMPIILGAQMSVNLTILGLRLRWLAKTAKSQ